MPPPVTVRIRRAEPETPLIGTAALTPEGAVFIPASGPVAPKSYYAKLPGAFAYPFKGAGWMVLIIATIGFSAMHFISGWIFGLLLRISLYGFVFLFMQNIILATTTNEKDPLAFPEASDLLARHLNWPGQSSCHFGRPSRWKSRS